MDSTNSSLIERVTNSIKQLSSAAQDLNTVSAEMGKAITAIDTVLQSLNIGVSTWARISGGSDEDGLSYWHRDLGYAKVANKWGISLRDVSGDVRDQDENCDIWLFNDAPRWLRIEGVAKVPDLIDALIKNTLETTEKIKTKTSEVNELATAIAQAAKSEKGRASELIASPGPRSSIAPPPPRDRLPTFIAPPTSIVNQNTPFGATKKPKGGK